MLLYLLIPTILIGVIYIFLIWNLNHWKKRGVSGPKPTLLFGNFSQSIRQKRNIVFDHQDIYNKYKGKEKFVGIYFARTPQLMVLDNELAKEILVKNFKNFHDNEFGNWFDLDPIVERNPFFLTGEAWKAKRAEITPVLSTAKLKLMYPVMQTVSTKITEYVKKQNAKPHYKYGYDAKELSQKFTTENMTNCLYGVEAGAFTEQCPIADHITAMVQNFFKMINHHFIITTLPFMKIFLRSPLMPQFVQTFFVNLMKDTIQLRKASQNTRFDILNYLMQTQEKKTLSDLDVVGHAMTFLIDGTETSSGVLAHIFNMLARYPEAQAKLRDEINAAVEEHGELSYEVLTELPYLDQVIHETIRLYPPANFLTRLCTEPCEIENFKEKKLSLKKNDILVIPVYCLHRDEEFYEDANTFNPDRFSPENGGFKKFKEMGVFYPFGDGPRQCIGMRLALTQMKVCVAEVIKNWEVCLNVMSPKEVVIDPKSFFIMPEGGIWIDLKKL